MRRPAPLRLVQRTPGSGSMHVRVERDSYFVCECSGLVTADLSRAAQEELDRLGEIRPDIDCVLYDGTGVDAFERGFAIDWIRWAQRCPGRRRRVAIVTRLAAGKAIAATARYLVPQTAFMVFTDRTAAISFLQASNDAGPTRR